MINLLCARTRVAYVKSVSITTCPEVPWLFLYKGE